MADETIYDFSFTKPDGQKLELSSFRGKVVLIVNTASECVFTKQYDGLERIYQKYKDKGLVVIAVPSNDFGNQEPGNDQEVQNFCRLNFGVTFDVTAKEVVAGKNAHPFYLWIGKKLGFGSAPKWNFHKYLIDRRGKPVDFFYSITAPKNSRLIKAIEKAL